MRQTTDTDSSAEEPGLQGGLEHALSDNAAII